MRDWVVVWSGFAALLIYHSLNGQCQPVSLAVLAVIWYPVTVKTHPAACAVRRCHTFWSLVSAVPVSRSWPCYVIHNPPSSSLLRYISLLEGLNEFFLLKSTFRWNYFLKEQSTLLDVVKETAFVFHFVSPVHSISLSFGQNSPVTVQTRLSYTTKIFLAVSKENVSSCNQEIWLPWRSLGLRYPLSNALFTHPEVNYHINTNPRRMDFKFGCFLLNI